MKAKFFVPILIVVFIAGAITTYIKVKQDGEESLAIFVESQNNKIAEKAKDFKSSSDKISQFNLEKQKLINKQNELQSKMFAKQKELKGVEFEYQKAKAATDSFIQE